MWITGEVETIGKKTRLAARKLLISLARPEGFEPPTPRSVEAGGSSWEILLDYETSILLTFRQSAYLPRA